MKQRLRMRDFLTFRPKEVEPRKKHLFECADETSPTGSSLLVRVAATHSGVVNGNERFYRPDRMQDSTNTWMEPGFPKPVLAHHQDEGDPLGRILRAKYVDLSYQYAQDYPIVKSTVFYNTDAKTRFNLFESVDWIVDHLMEFDDYQGLGYIELGLNITNTEAIQKVLNDEYLTVSVGFDTDQAYCSVCHQDWAVDDRCEHKLGARVDGKKAFLISGYFDYHEMSFVNHPADPFAGTISKGHLEDSRNQVFFLGLPKKEQAVVLDKIGDKCIDSINFEADIKVVPAEDSLMSDKLKKYLEELGKPELTKEKAFEIRDGADAIKPEGDEETKLHKRVVSTIRALIRKNGWEDKKETPTREQVEAKIASIKDLLANMSKEARPNYVVQVAAMAKEVGLDFIPPNLDEIEELDEWKLEDLPEEEREYFKDPDKLYEELSKEMDAAIADGELDAEDCKDAKLSTAARKKLKSGTFCGPNRSFPVPDCAHVVAARRLIGRYKGGGSKERILACVSRKASALGCGGGKKKGDQVEKNFEDRVKAIQGWKDSDTTKSALPHLKELDSLHKKAEDNDKYLLHSAASSMLENWSTARQFEYYRAKLAEDHDFIVIPKTEHEALQDGVVKAENDLKEQKAAAGTWQDTASGLVTNLKKTKAAQIVIFRVLSGEKGYQNLKTDEIKAKIEELASRALNSLEDAISDIFDKLAGFTAPVIPGTKEVKDDAQLPGEQESKPNAQESTNDPVLETLRDPQFRTLREAYNAIGSKK